MKKLHGNMNRVLAVLMALILALTPISPVSIWNDTRDVSAEETEWKELSQDDAYIVSLGLKQTLDDQGNVINTGITDGTAPTDATDGDGKDSGFHNYLIRTYDTLKYEVEYVTNTYSLDSYDEGYIFFEVELPYSKDEVYFDTDVMKWMSEDEGYHWEIITDPGTKHQTLKCARNVVKVDGNKAAIPGQGTVEFVLQVRGMRNGELIQPTFSAYMDHNEAKGSGEVCNTHQSEGNGGAEYVSMTPQAVEVTAAPGYNVKIATMQEKAAYTSGTWDFSAANGNENAIDVMDKQVNGRIIGMGITLQLYNEKSNKSIQGIEYPDPSVPITFDITLSTTHTLNGNTVQLTEEDYIPLVWSYGPSAEGESYDGRDVSSTYGNPYLVAPYNSNPNGLTLEQDGAVAAPADSEYCWNGGNWKIERDQDNPNVLHCTVSDFEINSNWFPARNIAEQVSNGGYSYTRDKNMGCFSAGELFLVVPYGEGDKYLGEGTIDVNAEISNFSAKPLSSDTIVTEQKNTGDDLAASVVHLTVPGDFTNHIYYGYYDNQEYIGWAEDVDQVSGGDTYNNGRDISSIGGKVAIAWGGLSDAKGDRTNFVEAGDFLLKFDDEALEVDTSKAFLNKMPDGVSRYYYAAKENGTGWDDDADMQGTLIDDLVYYETMADLVADGKTCVGILCSWRCGADDHSAQNKSGIHADPNNQDMVSKAFFTIKNDASLTNRVFQIVPVSRVWRVGMLDEQNVTAYDWEQIPNAYQIQQGSATEQPETTLGNVTNVYNKATYTASGVYSGGHNAASANGWEYGDSLYLTGYMARIQKHIWQPISDAGSDEIQVEDIELTDRKKVFDLDAGETIVDYVLSPRMILSDGITWNGTTTITIKDTLPKHMKYVTGSAKMDAAYKPATGINHGKGGTFVGGTAFEPVVETVTDDLTGDTYQVLTWTIENAPVVYEQPTISYKCEILKTVANSSNLDNTVTISTTEDTREHSAANGNLDQAGIQIVKLTSLAVTKKPIKSRVDRLEKLGYEISWSNNSGNVAYNQVLLDVMPRDDENSSDYNGDYELESLKVTSPDGNDYDVYYTTDNAVFSIEAKDLSYNDIKATGSSADITWTMADVDKNGTGGTKGLVDFGGASSNVTGWVILSNISGNNMVAADVVMNPTGNEPGDKYVNVGWLGESQSPATITVVGRELSGTTWIDADRNGIYDEGESLLDGVTVTLLDENGDVAKDIYGNDCPVLTTDENGKYKFENLPAGNFTVVFETEDGYILTQKDQGDDDALDSEAEMNGSSPQISDIVLPTAANMTTDYFSKTNQDAGFYQFGSLSVTKTVENAETGEENNTFEITVEFENLTSAEVAALNLVGPATSQVSGTKVTFELKANQSAQFTNVPVGAKYTVTEKDSALYLESIENAEGEVVLNGSNEVDVTNRRVNRKLSGMSWIDADKDGIRDQGEVALGDVTVKLLDEKGEVVKNLLNEDCEMTTGPDGSYSFENLPAGEFTIIFEDGQSVELDDYTLTKQEQGDDDTVDSNAQYESSVPTIDSIYMPTDEEILASDDVSYELENLDAGFYQAGKLTITKTVVGEQAADKEFTITVSLSMGAGAPVTEVVIDGEQQTSATGEYVVTLKDGESVVITDIPDGAYYTVSETDEALYREEISTENGEIDATQPVEVDVVNRRINRVLTGLTWNDFDMDGEQEDGEDPISGITVTLRNQNGVVVTDLTGEECITETDEDGKYIFENLPSGTFTVEFSDENGEPISDYILTVDNRGDDDKDSDAIIVDDEDNPTISGIIMPEDDAIDEGDLPYIVDHQDAGFHQFGSLKISKTVENAEANDRTEFDVTVSLDLPEGVSMTSLMDENGATYDIENGKVAVTISAGQPITFVNIPAGCVCTVTEADYGIYIVEGSGEEYTVELGEIAEAEIVNHRVNRVLSGRTWIDADKDGVQDNGEDPLSGVTVTLRYNDETGAIVEDLLGNECISQTDGTGDYIFENLPAGEFKVVFTDGQNVVIGEYTLTKTGQGDNVAVDSDASIDNGDPVISGIVMPEDGDIDINDLPYMIEHQDAGFYKAGKITISKTVIGEVTGEEDNEFEITLTLTAIGGAPLTEVMVNGVNTALDENGRYVFKVKADTVVEFTDIPDGTHYIVTEYDYGFYREGFVGVNEGDIENADAEDIQIVNRRINRIISGHTWNDVDQDGIQDPEEEPISGITVTLYDEEGDIVSDQADNPCVTETDEDGNYIFENLPPGTFTVVFSDENGEPISDYVLTVEGQGSDEAKDSDAVTDDGLPSISNIEMPVDDAIADDELPYKKEHLDAGFYQVGDLAISKTLVDTEDALLAQEFDVTVTLTAPGSYTFDKVMLSRNNQAATEIEVVNGVLTFKIKGGETVTLKNIPVGTSYVVEEADSILFKESITYGSASKVIVVGTSEVELVNKRISRSISGKTWNDLDQDGIQDPGEDPISGITVTLTNEDGDVVEETTTDEDGNYSFDDLPPGSYTVEFTDEDDNPLDDYTLTVPDNPSAGDEDDSDAKDENGSIIITDIELPDDDDVDSDEDLKVENLDAGFYQFGDLVISKTVVGIEGESELADREFEVTVTLTPPGDLVLTQVSLQRNYNGNSSVLPEILQVTGGKVTFKIKGGETVAITDLPAGTKYTVAEKDDPLFAESVAYADTEHKIKHGTSDVTITNKRVNRILTGTTWIDADKDGIFDDGEEPLPGITVTLIDEDGNVVDETVTDENGDYKFENVPPGEFTIVFTDENGEPMDDYTLTVPDNPDAGDADDSDANYEGKDPKITGIDMPSDDEIPDNTFVITDMDAGFYLVEKIAVSGTKTWEDENDKDGKRPESITIHLYADGVKIESKTVTAEENWSWIFTDLPKEKYGVEITYTIKEDGVEGYTTTYDGYNVTNTYEPSEPDEPVVPGDPGGSGEPGEPEKPDTPDEPDDPAEPGTPAPPTPPAPPATPNVPKTGDDAPLGLWMLLMILGFTGVVTAGAFAVKSKKKK